MIAAIGRLLQSFVFGILALFKRALCFLNRKRRDSGSILPTHIQNVDSSIPTQVLPASFEIPEQHSNPIQDDQVQLVLIHVTILFLTIFLLEC